MFMRKVLLGAMVTAVAALLLPVAATQAAELAFTTQPTIEFEQVKRRNPVPQTMTIAVSGQVDDGDETIDRMELTITDSTDDTTVCVIDDITADVRSLKINKKNCSDLNVLSQYSGSLVEYYESGNESRAGTATFRTAPPKLKRLRTPKKKRKANSIRVKFNRGVNAAGTSMYVDYVVTRRKNKSKIVENGTTYTRNNYVDISGLPANKKLSVKVALRSTSYGSGPWSKWKKFKTKKN